MAIDKIASRTIRAVPAIDLREAQEQTKCVFEMRERERERPTMRDIRAERERGR